jgi:DNA-binding NarL/FixJ family response regulator
VFTPRVELVLGLLERRLGNKEIASALSISERTVRFHLANIFRKLGVHNRYSVAEVTRSGGRFSFELRKRT